MARHELYELKQMQSLSMESKVRMTIARLKVWVDAFGVDGVYISFSGGKDSTVLLDIVRNQMGEKDIPAVFVDTGLEYPEIREFVKTITNVTWVKPKMNFKQVIEKYGYPLISKEISQSISEVRSYIAHHDGIPDGCYRYKRLIGESIDKKTGKLSPYNSTKWRFLLDSPFKISHQCCGIMKKSPAKAYEKQTGRKPITAQMACESRLRTSQWVEHGCNAFDKKRPISNPMSFWTEQDVLQYIKKYNIPICSVYGQIIEEQSGDENLSGQLTFSDITGFEHDDSFDASRNILKTTGCNRTGCMFCGFGCHLDKEGSGRFEKMKLTHPKQYEWIMKPWSEGGLGYKEVIDWLNEHGDLKIRY